MATRKIPVLYDDGVRTAFDDEDGLLVRVDRTDPRVESRADRALRTATAGDAAPDLDDEALGVALATRMGGELRVLRTADDEPIRSPMRARTATSPKGRLRRRVRVPGSGVRFVSVDA